MLSINYFTGILANQAATTIFTGVSPKLFQVFFIKPGEGQIGKPVDNYFIIGVYKYFSNWQS